MRLLFLAILLSGCSAQWHLEKALKKDPTLLIQKQIKTIDTLLVRDSIVYHDTFVAKQIDTITLENDKSEVVIYKYKNRFIIKTQIKQDTIRYTEKIEVPIIEYKERPNYTKWVLLGLGLFLIVSFVKRKSR